MTEEWIRSGLDIVLIVLIGAGLVQATRLIWHLAGLRAGRIEMANFVREFNATVLRAETGIKALKAAARESGDDLENLVNKSVAVRDELAFIVESADQLAERLTNAASVASGLARPEAKAEKKPAAAAQPPAPATPFVPEPIAASPKPAEAPKSAAVTPITSRREAEPKPVSRAEKELVQALKKLN